MADASWNRVYKDCDHCCLRETECDGSQPCSSCQEFGTVCVFRSQSKETEAAHPKSMEELHVPHASSHDNQGKFRYHVVLDAPTTISRAKDGSAVTYLNKGQVYSMSVVDKAPSSIPLSEICYRSYIRVSFDDHQQRQDPWAYWQLWIARCGVHEVSRFEGHTQAVEFVSCDSLDGLPGLPRVELDSTSLDGFSVLWYPSKSDKKGFTIKFKLNFLSADFIDAQGVEDVSVRLCVKTDMRFPGTSTIKDGTGGPLWAAETCYCRVKLFRSLKAEHQLSKDVAEVKKSIERVRRAIAKVGDSAEPDRSGKRKRNERDSTSPIESFSQRHIPNRLHPHNPLSSNERTQAAEKTDELRTELQELQLLFASTKPDSILRFKGGGVDDPDLYPLPLSSEAAKHFFETKQRASEDRKESHSPASSLHSQHSRGGSPPYASSMNADDGYITPPPIPFPELRASDQLDNHQRDVGFGPPNFAFEQVRAASFAPMVNEYQYQTIGSDEVRLLVLYPGKFNNSDSISCGLKVMPFRRLEGSKLVYQALSYAWGPDTDLKKIHVRDVSPLPQVRSDFYIRPSLHAALKRLRSESVELWFWIDAICINQKNLTEKAEQLLRMLDIYCNAWSVCIWLGEPETSDSLIPDEPLDLIATIIDLKLLDYMVEEHTTDQRLMSSLVAFAKLLKKPWFRRRWVIQEVSSSTRAAVQYGQKKINWVDFADAVQLFILKLDRIRAMYRGSKLFENDPDALSHVEAAGAIALVRATQEVLRKSKDGRIVARLCDIETLVMRFVHFQASDARDTIFALWALADVRGRVSDESDFIPLRRQPHISPPSYVQPCETIYADFVCHCIRLHNSLDIICRHWALYHSGYAQSEDSPRMPSWVSTTENSPFGMYRDSGGRMNGDSLVGVPGRKVYNASNNTSPSGEMLADVGPDIASMLRVRGHVVMQVLQVSPRIVDGIVPYDTLRLLGWVDKTTVNTIPDGLWRTLVADRANDGSIAPSWWRRAAMFALSMASRDGDLNTSKMLQNKSLPQTVHEYLQRVQAIVWNRRVFAGELMNTSSESGGIPATVVTGLGPRDAQQGDIACILLGCSVPVIIRKIPSTEPNGIYKLVGECYIPGMMDGEALSPPPSGGCSSRRMFNLI